jgi:hypothetical protein
MWYYLWAVIESWLMAVNCVGRHTGSWSYLQRSTRYHVNESKKINLGWMLYSVYTVLQCILYFGVCCTRCMLYSVYAVLGVCCTQCQLMIITWRDREGWLNFVFCDDDRVVDEKERDGRWRRERCGGYERIWEIRGTLCLIGLGRLRISSITHWIGTRICCIADGYLTPTRNSLKSQFLMTISPIISHLSLSRPQLYHHLKTQSQVIALYISMPWSRVNTEYSLHWAQHTLSTAYAEYSIHQVQHTPSTAYTKYSIHQVQHTPSTVYTKYSILQVQLTLSTAYTKYSIHQV